GGERDRAVEHEVRHVPEEHLVLAAERLTLRCVDDDDRAATPAADGGELAGNGERGPAAALQTARLDHLEERRSAPPIEGSVSGQVLRERHRTVLVDACEQPRHGRRIAGGQSAHTTAPATVPVTRVR